MDFGRDPRWLGAEMGFSGVLHTWGQNLSLHPHVHFVVASGGLSDEGEWVEPRYKDTFLFPVKALSARFRKLFIKGLKEAFGEKRLHLPPDLESDGDGKAFKGLLRALGRKEFVAYIKAPFGGPEGVVRYVGRYTHRVAISNGRILSIDDGKVRFTYKDYRSMDAEGKCETKEMALDSEEFIRRFLQHVLPKGFHKIRHYGFLANGRKARLDQARWSLFTEDGRGAHAYMEEEGDIYANEGIPCPVCGVGRLLPVFIYSRYAMITVRNISYLRLCESDDYW